MMRAFVPLLLSFVAAACGSGPDLSRPAEGDADGGSTRSAERSWALSEAASAEGAGAPRTWAESLDEWVFGSPGDTLRNERERSARSAIGPAAGSVAPGEAASAPGEWRRLVLKAGQAIAAGRPEDAVPSLERAAEAAPEGERWIPERALADLLLALRRDEESAALYRRTLERFAALHGNLAVAAYRLGRLSAARREAEEALALRPDYPEALKTLGLVEIADGRTAEGVARLEGALRRAEMPEAELALAQVAEEKGDSAGALRRYRALLESYEKRKSTDYHRRWANLFHPGGKATPDELKARIERLEAILQRSPGTPGEMPRWDDLSPQDPGTKEGG